MVRCPGEMTAETSGMPRRPGDSKGLNRICTIPSVAHKASNAGAELCRALYTIKQHSGVFTPLNSICIAPSAAHEANAAYPAEVV